MVIIGSARPTCAQGRKTRRGGNLRSIRSCERNTWQISTSREPRSGNSFTPPRIRRRQPSSNLKLLLVAKAVIRSRAPLQRCRKRRNSQRPFRGCAGACYKPMINVHQPGSPLEMSRLIARTRRDFLRSAAGMALGSALLPSRAFARSSVSRSGRKVIVITFGGGARDQETFAPEGQENIPHLMRELLPRSAFFTQVVNRGILGHYAATASLATGVYETINNFASLPPEHPTVFEYFRKDLRRPSSDAWVVAPSNGFNRIGESSYRSYGPGSGARVILPTHLLAAASQKHADYEHLLRDNYETPYYAPALQGGEFELRQLEEILKLSVDDFKAHARTLSSPDELSVSIVRQLMRQVAPSLLWITMHDIDVAHAGAFSLCIDGIRRTDRLG